MSTTNDPIRAEIERLAFEADPNDGLRVVEVPVGAERSLHLGVFAKGRPVRLFDDREATLEVWSRRLVEDGDHGDRDRSRLLLEAVCRFLNTGGTPAELNWLVGEVRSVARDTALGFGFDGFRLINSQFNTDGACEHLFAKDGCPYIIRWVEGQFMDVITDTTLLNETRQQQQRTKEGQTVDDPAAGPGPGSVKGELPGPGDRDAPA